jgi:hypothetical protein
MGVAGRAPKTSARQLDHARRDINADATRYFGCKGEEMVAIAATEIQYNVVGAGPGEAAHQPDAIFEQPLRVAVLFGRSRCGASIKERPDVRAVAGGSRGDTPQRRPRPLPPAAGCWPPRGGFKLRRR